ncbi:hypothetical protein PRZ48_008413 [Zasmidium cellare]|uniref:Uncharacterized protein n=1 Tax=Zasmidium cellare TaxID=395010 RepID=A0ABR0EG60_ZASCE|nr:hypothetical protein PRZ48_008413 [Zasmidium cellare]
MAFGRDFESKFNENMQDDGQPGPALSEFGDNKAGKKKSCYYAEPAHEDFEMHEKKDQPPRFSTIFGSTTPPAPPPPQQAPREYVQEYYPRPEKKSGVFMPMPLFIVFAVILLFESTILFAYTVIGLYNNAPSRLFPWAGQGAAVAAACDCTEHQPAINISPNFVLPQGGEPVTEKFTISITPTTSSTSTTASSTTSSSTSTADSTSQAAAIASDIAGILGSLTSSSSSSSSSPVATVTYTPPQSTVDVTMVITSDANTESAAPPPTVTLTTEVPPPSSTGAAITSRDALAWASVSSANAAIQSALIPDPIPSTTSTPTTLETSTTTPPPSTTEQSTSDTPVSSAAGKVCFGGAGGVQLNCV